MNAKIFILEDDKGINQLLSINLKNEGFNVITTFDGKEAIETFDHTFDLAILDIMVPIYDGFEVLKHIRKTSFIPVMFLTAKDEEINKLMALGIGADDYVTKPFSIMELIYRCKALIRRSTEYANAEAKSLVIASSLSHGDINMNISKFEATLNGEPIKLSVKEFDMLKFFIENAGQVFTKKQLYEQIWKDIYQGDDNTIMVHISKLREKLLDNTKRPKYIKTIKGLGYRMEEICK